MQNNKKMAAAMAAVSYYIKTQEEAAAMAANPIEEEEPIPVGSVNLWGVSGRQSQMQMRNLMQMKAFHR